MKLGTMSGRLVDITNPDPNDIDIDDIAIGLSQQNRYAGQTPIPFSVGQHTIAIMGYLEENMPALETRYRRAALMHDFPEYILQDFTNPFKAALRQYTSAYDDMTLLWENAIVERFGWFENGDDYRRAFSVIAPIDREAYLAEAIHMNLTAHNIKRYDPAMLRAVKWAAEMSPLRVQHRLRHLIQLKD